MGAIRITLLGGFAVHGEGSPAAVRGLIPQGVIARLAVAGGVPLPAESLVADLWPDPPDEVVSSLRAHISRLRARGWGHLVSGGREGYRLDPAGISVDVGEFEQTVLGRGSPALHGDTVGDRRTELTAALALWRPEPLAWARSFPFAVTLEGRLRHLHRLAVLELAGLDLADDHPARAAAALAALRERGRGADAVRTSPPDRDLDVLLATALARDGRAAEALQVIDEHLRASAPTPPQPAAAGTGVPGGGSAPVADVERLRDAILRQDASLLGGGGTGAAGGPTGVERIGLPPPRTELVGRVQQLDAVRRARGAARLVTLTGAAGVGKSRLAEEVAWRADPDEDEVQWLVDLSAARSVDDVVASVASTMGATESSLAEAAAMVGGRRGLLVLDNAEHVLEAVSLVCATLLGECAGLGVIVTSRESLRLAGERVITVPPMLGPDLRDAVELFRQRSAATVAAAGDAAEWDATKWGAAQWDAARIAAVERLCIRLDGLPLALELAASRLGELGFDELAASVMAAVPVPDEPATPERSTRTHRHESIDTAIAWSMRLTSPAEQLLLVQLGGFAGGASLDMIAGICVLDGHDVRQTAVSLVRKSLVHTLSGPGERRFRVFESVRHHVRRALPPADEQAWSRRHATWLLEAARQEARRLASPDAAAARAAVRSMRLDLERARAWSIAACDRELAVGLAAALGPFWRERGLTSDSLTSIDAALALPGALLPHDESAALHGAFLIAAASGDLARAARYAERFHETAQQAGDASQAMSAAAYLAFFAAAAGDTVTMDALLTEAETHRSGAHDDWTAAEYLVVRGDVLRLAGRPAQALEALGRAYRLGSDADHGWARGSASFITGRTLVDVGRTTEALPILRSAVIRLLESEDAPSALAAATVYAAALIDLDGAARAAELLGAIDAAGERVGYRGSAIDQRFDAAARARASAALSPGQWESLLARGRTRSLGWLVDHLTP